ncbi:MAG: hypothetical protein GX221_08455 [Candidatus Riflebacteria bacterium]|nr:hypothetical protein [Candidatus Riflebacteria bacterium]
MLVASFLFWLLVHFSGMASMLFSGYDITNQDAAALLRNITEKEIAAASSALPSSVLSEWIYPPNSNQKFTAKTEKLGIKQTETGDKLMLLKTSVKWGKFPFAKTTSLFYLKPVRSI